MVGNETQNNKTNRKKTKKREQQHQQHSGKHAGYICWIYGKSDPKNTLKNTLHTKGTLLIDHWASAAKQCHSRPEKTV